jgi:diguanylate cyclase (GGDEF)-like protein
MLVKEADGTPTDWMMGTHIDVSEEQEAQQQLTNLAASVPGILFSFVIESTDVVRFTYISQRSYDYLGREPEAIEANSSVFFDAIHESDVTEVYDAIHRSYESISETSCQFRIVMDDSECWFQASAKPIRDPHGNLVWHGMVPYIDEQKKLDQKLASLAVTDELTGLFNRRYMAQVLNDAIELYQRYQTTFSLISLDLDYFKQINDSHGHGVGDRVLVKIGELMKNRVRATDIVSRMGGEEFLVLLPNTPEHAAIEVAELLRQAVRQTELSNDQNSAFIVTVSGGVVEMTDDISSAEDLLKRSDRLLYEAKERGRDRILTELDALTK